MFIRDFLRQHKKELLASLYIFLVSFVSFGVGYLVRGESAHPPIIINQVQK